MKNQKSNTILKRGRPPKKDYDPEVLMRELIDTVSEVYRTTREIKATALELSLPPNKVKKLLITGGDSDLSGDRTDSGSHAAGKNHGGDPAYDGPQLLRSAHISWTYVNTLDKKS